MGPGKSVERHRVIVADEGRHRRDEERLIGVVETLRPACGVYCPPTPQRDFQEYERLTPPLATDGINVGILGHARRLYTLKRIRNIYTLSRI